MKGEKGGGRVWKIHRFLPFPPKILCPIFRAFLFFPLTNLEDTCLPPPSTVCYLLAISNVFSKSIFKYIKGKEWKILLIIYIHLANRKKCLFLVIGLQRIFFCSQSTIITIYIGRRMECLCKKKHFWVKKIKKTTFIICFDDWVLLLEK